jgi:FkbM family methyltransferase
LVVPNGLDGSRAARLAVQDLLAERVEVARERERRTFTDFAGPCGDSILLFGAGGLGRRCLAGLRRKGLEPLAFADSNQLLWNTEVDGLRVLSPGDAADRFGKGAVFVITIWGARAPDRMSDRVSQLQLLGCERVMPFGPLFWKYPDHVLPHYAADLPHKVIDQSHEILEAFDLLADDESRMEYVAQLRWRLFFDFDRLSPPGRDIIYLTPDLVRLRSDEVFVDCGAFDGDTLSQFLTASKNVFDRIIAFEPDPVNFARLSDSVAALPQSVKSRIDLEHCAVGAEDGRLRFSAEGAPSSHVGEGDLVVDVVALDRYLGATQPTFIKMDIEGAEPDALSGAKEHIRSDSPTLAISCYHRQDHLWTIPRLIHSINPDYAFYLRPHDLEVWDLVCYAIPRSTARPTSPH